MEGEKKVCSLANDEHVIGANFNTYYTYQLHLQQAHALLQSDVYCSCPI